jgi:hypothetical protein
MRRIFQKNRFFGLNAIKITQNGRSKEYGNTTFRTSPVIGSISFFSGDTITSPLHQQLHH